MQLPLSFRVLLTGILLAFSSPLTAQKAQPDNSIRVTLESAYEAWRAATAWFFLD